MSIRIRETYGTSWRGTRPGTRHWRSTSVSFGLGSYLLGYGIWSLFVIPLIVMWWLLLAEVWLVAEVYAAGISGIVVLISWWKQPATRYRARWAKWGWLWVLTAQ